jgi:hypothetical protein
MKEPKPIVVNFDRACPPPYDVYFRVYSLAEVNFLERLQYYFRGHTDAQAVIDAWENYGNSKNNGVIPEPNGGDKLPKMIYEIIIRNRSINFGDILGLIKDECDREELVGAALDWLVDSGKIGFAHGLYFIGAAK